MDEVIGIPTPDTANSTADQDSPEMSPPAPTTSDVDAAMTEPISGLPESPSHANDNMGITLPPDDAEQVSGFTMTEDVETGEHGTAVEATERNDSKEVDMAQGDLESNIPEEGQEDKPDYTESNVMDTIMNAFGEQSEQEQGYAMESTEYNDIEPQEELQNIEQAQHDGMEYAQNDSAIHQTHSSHLQYGQDFQHSHLYQDNMFDETHGRPSSQGLELPSEAEGTNEASVEFYTGTQLLDNGVATEPDGNSLFIPESDADSSPGQQGVPSHHSDISPHNAPKSKGTSALPFSTIRAMQKRLQKSKSGGRKTTSTGSSLIRPSPEDDSHLDAYLNKNKSIGGHAVAQGDDNDEEDKRAAETFRRQKKHYDNIRREKGRLTFRQDIEWAKIRQAEQIRLKKRDRDLQLLREERHSSELFPGDPMDDTSEDDDINEAPANYPKSGKRSGGKSSQKESQQCSLQEQEYRAMMVQLEADGELPKNKKRKNNEDDDQSQISTPRARKKTHKASKSKGAKPAPKVTRLSAKQKREQQRQMQSVASLFSSNVFTDQAAQDAAEQPTFKSKNKDDALKELIASVAPENQKTARTDVQVLLNASREFDGHGSVKADGNSLWLVKGMKTSLKPYQVLGTSFMRKRERSLEEPRGGLLADQMGLGKTLMMLANIVNGKAAKGEVKTTLLVASPNLLTQWAREIETHTDCGLKVLRYGPGTRLSSNCDHKVLLEFDIVLTTYHEILRSYPKNEPPIWAQTAEQKIEWWKKIYETQRGILHRVPFYRIVLDEAQAIKNHVARTSIACRALLAKHRWALSGTPILNGLIELYPYFKFLNVPHTGSFKIFKNNYTDTSNPENAERLLLRLNQFMIRRTHKDVMFGAPILKLPKANQLTHWVEFNSVERNIYEIVQTRFCLHINSLSKSGEIDKSYSNILVLLLRLRQLTSHVLMLQFVMRDLLERDDLERIRQVVNDSHDDHTSGHTIIAIREQLDALSKEEKNRSRTNMSQGQSTMDDSTRVDDDDYECLGNRMASGGSFGKEYDFKPYLNSLTTGESWEKAKKQAKCCICGTGPHNLNLTSCHHLYCTPCYEAAVGAAAEHESDVVICHRCGQKILYTELCDSDPDPDFQGFEDGEVRSSKKSKERNRPEREDIKDDWLTLGGESMLPSAKTIAIKAQILNWIKENPSVKIIIYTQFLPMIRILARICKEEGWPTEQYHGKLNFQARDKAITRFADDPATRVLLASLRCGGLGLNLTMASRVIVIDPWWNSAAEQQAFCRVFRIGQKETTFMTRFCVRNTVDDRLIDMQERKQREIDEIMEDDGKRIKRLSIRDLMRLFGPVTEDANGKPFILVDNVDPKGSFLADKDHEGFVDEE